MPKRKPKPPRLSAAESCAIARAARSNPEGTIGKLVYIVAAPELIDRISDMTPVERGQFLASSAGIPTRKLPELGSPDLSSRGGKAILRLKPQYL